MQPPASFGISESQLSEIQIPSDLRRAKDPESSIMRVVERFSYDADACFAIKLSLEEAVTNAVKHGNQHDPNKTVTVRYFCDDERFVAAVCDQGSGFHLDHVPDPTSDENLERPSGRGLMLMQSYMTEVAFNEQGNEVWMLKINPAARKRPKRQVG